MPATFDLETKAAVTGDLTSPKAKVRAKTDTEGAKDFTYSCDDMTKDASSAMSTCTKGKDGQKIYGEYSVISVKDETETNALTLADATGNIFTLEQPFVVAGQQTAKQTVDETTKTFTIKMESGDIAPKFYPGNEQSTTALSSCTYDAKALTVTCTPTNTEMKKDTDYKIYYKKPCETTFTDSGITVTYKGSSEPTPTPTSSAFTALSKILLFFAGLLLL